MSMLAFRSRVHVFLQLVQLKEAWGLWDTCPPSCPSGHNVAASPDDTHADTAGWRDGGRICVDGTGPASDSCFAGLPGFRFSALRLDIVYHILVWYPRIY